MTRMPVINAVAKLPESFGMSGNRKPWRLSLPSHMKLLIAFLLIFSPLAVTHVAEASGAETTLNSKLLGQFLQKHCFRCHGAQEQNGSARFDTLDYAISNKVEALHYQDVLDVLNGGDMPPEDEPQPSNAELEVVIGELTEGLFKARKRLASNGGKVVMRRLNRREYAATIRHLFGFEPPRQRIPPDDDVVNFDTVGSRQFFTTSHFDEYYGLAQEVLREGFKWAGVREAVQTRVDAARKQLDQTVSARMLSVGKGRLARSCGSRRCERSISRGPWWKVVSTSMNPYGTSVLDRWSIHAVVTGFESRLALKEK